MKLKKALSGILAAAMVVTMVPSMVFATTTNTVTKTYTVAADEDMPVVALDLEVKNSDGLVGGVDQKIKIHLENAEWAVDDADENNLVDNTGDLKSKYNVSATTKAGIAVYTGASGSVTTDLYSVVKASSVDDNVATITVTPGTTIQKGNFVRIYFALHAGTEDGEVKITIDGGDSDISSGTHTVATVSGSTTVATVTGSVKTYPRQTVTGATVEMTETAVTSVSDDQILKLTLPSNYEWKNVKITGDLANRTQEFGTGGGVSKNSETDVKAGGVGKYYFDGRTAYVYVDIAPNATIKQDLVITPTFEIKKDAAMGDVNMSISGYYAASGDKVSSASGLTIAKYGDEYVSVTNTDEIPDVVAGFIKDTDDKYFVAEVKITEGVKGSLSSGRFIDFDFNDQAAIVTDADVKYYVGTGSSDYDKAKVMNTNLITKETDKTKDCSEMTITVPSNASGLTLDGWKFDKANTLTLYIPITVKGNYTGDVTVNVSGSKAGIDETDLVIAKAIAPITVETSVTNVINGAQAQALADITVTENVPGYIKSNEYVKLTLDTLNISDGYSLKASGCKAEVTAGDLELKSGDIVKNSGSEIDLVVKNSSVVASTVKVTGVVINMARNLPSGEYDLKAELMTGSGSTKGLPNRDYDNANFKSTVTKPAYVNITTAAENITVSDSFTATFVIGEASYTNNGTATEMDAAAYIDSHNRTMVPIRYVANACGISENDIRWEAGSQTAIINGLNTVVTVKMGSNKLQTSTGEITMDTVAVNNNGRIYVPVRYIANALGANVSWDAATKTVTLTK